MKKTFFVLIAIAAVGIVGCTKEKMQLASTITECASASDCKSGFNCWHGQCVSNEGINDMNRCTEDSDCVPASCCHPAASVRFSFAESLRSKLGDWKTIPTCRRSPK